MVKKASAQGRGLVHRLELAEVKPSTEGLSPEGFVTPVNESSSAPNSIIPLELLWRRRVSIEDKYFCSRLWKGFVKTTIGIDSIFEPSTSRLQREWHFSTLTSASSAPEVNTDELNRTARCFQMN